MSTIIIPSREERYALLEKVGRSLLKFPYKSWNFGDSTGFEAIMETGRVLKDPTYVPYAYGWMKAWASRQQPYHRLDCTAPGSAMVEMAHLKNDMALLEALVPLARYLMSRPLTRGTFEVWDRMCLMQPYGGEELPDFEAQLLASPPGGSCVDCMHFDPPFFTSLGKALGIKEFVEVGVQQLLAYIEVLQKENGIFDHFFLNGVEQSFAPGWGRGQGWALLGMLDVLKNISPTHPSRPRILESCLKLIEAMLELQREDGRWWCVVQSSRSGEEGSTAGFMATGFARAIKMGLVDESRVFPAMKNAVAAVIADADEQGELRNVTAAVFASTRVSHYEFTPRGYSVPWGQGPLALAICETDDLL